MEKKGFIHLYCGDGKGKTTAAVGLAVRHIGAGGRVLFVQFLKDGTSSEIPVLKSLGAKTLYDPNLCGFTFTMTDAQKEECRRKNTEMLKQAASMAGDYSLVVLDELMGSVSTGLLGEQEVLSFLREKPECTEVVMTGRNPTEGLRDAADYITEMKKLRHPFSSGVKARRGIEF